MPRPPGARLLARARTAARRQHVLAARKAQADEWLLWGAIPRDHSELLTLRANELTSDKNRRRLARLCQRFLTELDNPRCRAYATNRTALRAHRALLAQLAQRLADPNTPVSPRGVILTQHALLDGAGPLFNPAHAYELGPALTRALEALDSTHKTSPKPTESDPM